MAFTLFIALLFFFSFLITTGLAHVPANRYQDPQGAAYGLRNHRHNHHHQRYHERQESEANPLPQSIETRDKDLRIAALAGVFKTIPGHEADVMEAVAEGVPVGDGCAPIRQGEAMLPPADDQQPQKPPKKKVIGDMEGWMAVKRSPVPFLGTWLVRLISGEWDADPGHMFGKESERPDSYGSPP